jgi:hypothetical protein
MHEFKHSVMVLAVAGLVAACAGGDTEQDAGAEADTSQAAADTGMQGMPGMRGIEAGRMTEMLTQMQSHMQMMQNMNADSMQSMLPEHRQMAANMLAQMDREMREMNMVGDTAWRATADSLRKDLARMPEMSGQELQTIMPGHQQRIMRLMEMHRRMMGNVRM